MAKATTAQEAKEDWWDIGTIDDDKKKIYHEVLDDYLESFGIEPGDCKEVVSLCRTLIPGLGQRVPQWDGFLPKFFLVNNYAGHRAFHNCIANRLETLVNEKARKEKEAEQARQAAYLLQQQQ